MLYEGKVPDVDESALAQQAERMTQRFLLHYHHAVPFDRRTLEAAWRRCRGDDCEDRQREAWQRLSSLDGEAAQVLSESAAPSERGRTVPAWDAEEVDASEEDDRGFDSRETE